MNTKKNNYSDDLTPQEIVRRLDQYIIGQDRAKRAVAVAIRNRFRRSRIKGPFKDEIIPKNIIMIGPTGVGKTEIARRLSLITDAPFIKVEATKYTEVGYVGRDVESIIRDLTEIAVRMVRNEKVEQIKEKLDVAVRERLLDLLQPLQKRPNRRELDGQHDMFDAYQEERYAQAERIREKYRQQLATDELDERHVSLEVSEAKPGVIEILSGAGLEEITYNLREALSPFSPSKKKKKSVPIGEAKRILFKEELDKAIDMERVITEAIERLEQSGIVFVDEVDKVVGADTTVGPDVSREGVQRDILPLVEGTTVVTKYGPIRTHHILFIAAGAFHISKPSSLIPEFQGRFPIRVELDPLTKEDFERILIEPNNALIKQYTELLRIDKVALEFTPDGIQEIAYQAEFVNERTENIGARRLHTLLEFLLEEISFNAPFAKLTKAVVDREFVINKLKDVVEDRDLSRFIL